MSCVKFKNAPFQPNKSNFQSTDPKYKELCNNEEKSRRFHIFELSLRDNAIAFVSTKAWRIFHKRWQ